jgi:hypothetical protein
MTFDSREVMDHLRAQTIRVRAAKNGCVTPSMMASRSFINTDVIGIVENPRKRYMVEKRVSPTIIRRRLKSKVFGIAK